MASAMDLHDGTAGTNGGVLVGLTQDSSDMHHWFADGAALEPGELTSLQTASTYINVHSDTFPAGELRGQILPRGYELILTPLSGSEQIPAVVTAAEGVAAATLQASTGWLRLHADTMGVDDATAAHLYQGFSEANGPVLIGLAQDGSNMPHCSASLVLSPEQKAALEAGELYYNVACHSDTDRGPG